MTYNEHRMVLAAIHQLERKIDHMASSTQAGLAALQQADSDLAAAVTAAVADIASISAQLTNLESEDPQVASIAADLEAKVTALNAAIAPPAPAPAS